MNNHILLLTKDALCKDYLPLYGNRYWEGKTPNIDEISATMRLEETKKKLFSFRKKVFKV